MTAQLPLPFAPRKLAATADPETSHAAARQCKALRGEHHAAILAVLRAASDPITAEEIGVRAGLSSVQVLRRMHELTTAGLAVADGEGLTCTGRRARCFRVD